MSENKTPDDNVVPFHKDQPDTVNAQRVTDEPYSTPSRAIALMLKKGGFDVEALNQGPLEIRIIAEFTEIGAMFHAIGAMKVPPKEDPLAQALSTAVLRGAPEPPPTSKDLSKLDAPAMTFLKILADDRALGRLFFINMARVAELDILDRELAGASLADLERLSMGSIEEQDAVVARLGCTEAMKVITNLLERAEG